jgi:Holliday junction resolvase-like predicted endonuclease
VDSPAKLPLPGLQGDTKPEGLDAAEEVELSELEEVELNEPAEVGTSAPAKQTADAAPVEKEDPPSPAIASRARRSAPLGIPDATGLRGMLADQPELLEPGLSVFANEKGTPLGAGYTSSVGEIDLLARDADGGFVVVVVAESHEGEELISGALQRIGWVRKHLSKGEKSVRAIVLLDRARDDIAYAAAAVADTVKFKTYRVALRFDDLEF